MIAPPTGYSYACGHRALRLLANRLADLGHDVLRFDYDGTGDAAGDQWDGARVAAWRQTLADAVAWTRDAGAERVTIVGARIGATLALLDGEALRADRIVAWLPVARGRRYAKEIGLLSELIPAGADPLGERNTRVWAGNVFSDETIRELRDLTITDVQRPPARSVLVLDDRHGTAEPVVERLREVGTRIEHLVLDQAEGALETPPEYAPDSDRVVAAAARWIGDAPAVRGPRGAGPPARLRTRASFAWRGSQVAEEHVALGPEGHAAIITEPPRRRPHETTLVLLNPGSETHIGPGRAWVEYARDLAARGRTTVRVDFVGWGESPDGPFAPGHPYDPSCVADALSIVAALRDAGHERIALAGLCASAWIALDAARHGTVDGVVAINPQMYWRQGDPVEIDWDLIRAGRATEIRRVRRGARAGLWSALDVVGSRPRVARWLDELVASPTQTELVFAERDDGIVYLEQRIGRHLARLTTAGKLGVQELRGVDHPMHSTWLRGAVADALARALERIDEHRVTDPNGIATGATGVAVA